MSTEGNLVYTFIGQDRIAEAVRFDSKQFYHYNPVTSHLIRQSNCSFEDYYKFELDYHPLDVNLSPFCEDSVTGCFVGGLACTDSAWGSTKPHDQAYYESIPEHTRALAKFQDDLYLKAPKELLQQVQLGRVLMLRSLAVDQAHIGRGIAQRLLAMALERAQQVGGLTYVAAECISPATSYILGEKFGFKLATELYYEQWGDGEFCGVQGSAKLMYLKFDSKIQNNKIR